MIDKIYPIACMFLLLLWSSGEVMGQFVRLRLEIPAGMSFDAKVIAPNPQNPYQQMVWIEMVANENLTVLFDLRQEDTGEFHESGVFYLNDGSVNFAFAKPLSTGSQKLQFDKRGLLIRNIEPMTNKLHAWLGLPAAKGLIATLEYP